MNPRYQTRVQKAASRLRVAQSKPGAVPGHPIPEMRVKPPSARIGRRACPPVQAGRGGHPIPSRGVPLLRAARRAVARQPHAAGSGTAGNFFN